MTFCLHKEDAARTYYHMINIEPIESNVIEDMILVREVGKLFCDYFLGTGSADSILCPLLYEKALFLYSISNQFYDNTKDNYSRQSKFDYEVEIEKPHDGYQEKNTGIDCYFNIALLSHLPGGFSCSSMSCRHVLYYRADWI